MRNLFVIRAHQLLPPILKKNGGMAVRCHSGYLVSRRRGALSHAEALATGERLHLDSVHIPNSFVSVHLAELLDRELREFDTTTQVVDI